MLYTTRTVSPCRRFIFTTRSNVDNPIWSTFTLSNITGSTIATGVILPLLPN